MRALAAFCLLSLSGCAGATALESKNGQDEDRSPDEDGDTGADDTDEAAFVEVWYAMAGKLRVEDGGASLTDAELRFVLGGLDATGGIERRECEALDVATLQVGTPPVVDGYTISAWWELAVPTTTGCEGTLGLPSTLGLGLGSLHPEIIAQLGTVDLDDAHDSLAGAWIQADSGEPFAFGYAQGAGGVGFIDALPNDLYTFEPLLILELAE